MNVLRRLCFLIVLAGFGSPSLAGVPLERLKLPSGFKISVFAEEVGNARSLALGANGTVFVGTRSAGNVHALRDKDGDGRADERFVLASGLRMPNGVAFRDGALYVAEVSRILRFDAIEKALDNPPKPVVVYDKLPRETHHGWKFVNFGPDGLLYIPIGAPCNVCDNGDPYATIARLDVGSGKFDIFARGVRNSVGFDWHPQSKTLWFSDNGRDMMGDDVPECELNHAPKASLHFGFPFCHQGDVADPQFGKARACKEFTPPAQNVGPHVAPLGVRFYTGNMFPPEYKNRAFIALHGSWNRSSKSGYKVMTATIANGKVEKYEAFIEGWLEGQSEWGRPVDMLTLPDGSMLLSDDAADVIYRITYARRTAMPRQAASAPGAVAIGPYSAAVRAGEWVFLSGQTPIDAATGQLVPGDVRAQTRQCFANLFSALGAAQMSADDVVKVNVYLIDMNDFAAMNEVYRTQFAQPFPARTTIGVAALPLGAKVEIEMIARK